MCLCVKKKKFLVQQKITNKHIKLKKKKDALSKSKSKSKSPDITEIAPDLQRARSTSRSRNNTTTSQSNTAVKVSPPLPNVIPRTATLSYTQSHNMSPAFLGNNNNNNNDNNNKNSDNNNNNNNNDNNIHNTKLIHFDSQLTSPRGRQASAATPPPPEVISKVTLKGKIFRYLGLSRFVEAIRAWTHPERLADYNRIRMVECYFERLPSVVFSVLYVCFIYYLFIFLFFVFFYFFVSFFCVF